MKYLKSYRIFENTAEIDEVLITAGDVLQDIFDEYEIVDINDRGEDLVYYMFSDDRKYWKYHLHIPDEDVDRLKRMLEDPEADWDKEEEEAGTDPYYKRSIEIKNITIDIVEKIKQEIPRIESMTGHKLKIDIKEAQDMSWMHKDQITRMRTRQKTYEVNITVK
jgi:hypothetical protein